MHSQTWWGMFSGTSFCAVLVRGRECADEMKMLRSMCLFPSDSRSWALNIFAITFWRFSFFWHSLPNHMRPTTRWQDRVQNQILAQKMPSLFLHTCFRIATTALAQLSMFSLAQRLLCFQVPLTLIKIWMSLGSKVYSKAIRPAITRVIAPSQPCTKMKWKETSSAN